MAEDIHPVDLSPCDLEPIPIIALDVLCGGAVSFAMLDVNPGKETSLPVAMRVREH